MTQTVLNFFSKQYLLTAAGIVTNPAKPGLKSRKLFLTSLGAFISLVGMAQTTYTTKANGSWTSSATWVGGLVPGSTITAAQTVIIKHAVQYSVNSDLTIAGKLNITADTLRFDNAFNKNVVIQSTGVLSVTNGGFIQDVTANKADLLISGRFIANSAKIAISKGIDAKAGSKSNFTNSTILINSGYTIDGTSALPSIDTIKNSNVQVSLNKSGDFSIKDYVTLRVDNAKVTVGAGKFKTSPNSAVSVLLGAANNYGFNVLKTSGDLETDGPWNARIDAYCVGGSIKGSTAADIDFTRPEDCSTTATSAPAPELSFTSPVLVKGNDKKQGAVYRFSNIAPGVDAEIKLKKFSRSDIVMNSIDNSALGWNKAFQPEFGLAGVVAPNQNWYIDFEMTFYEAGKNKKTKVQRADFTALDVDGDGWSIAEYASFSNPANVAYSSFSSLASTPAGSLGSVMACGVCNVSSTLNQCLPCHGTGDVLGIDCLACDGNGVLFSGCNHPYEGVIGNVLQGPVQNYNNIDTAGTAVMATFQYVDVDQINFRYGARSASLSSNGSGIRLNSMWSKSFALSPWVMLPVNFSSFAVLYTRGDASINWQAQNGEQLNHFIVQRSTDGKTYTDIASVLANSTATYSYKDKGVSSATGVVYYRVASIDKTKEMQYTVVKTIRLSKNEMQTIALTTYPNPAVSDVRITLPNAWQGKAVALQLYTANGIMAKSIQLGSAGQTETMMLSGLAKGLYVVKATCGDEAAQQRIVKN
ncbi:MAG: hypothetical protein JWR72_1352 [Flavisolibacter sp.]|jgi:hypothetical protein|nr:hypothetical protein [Flavisolibacter sp.]